MAPADSKAQGAPLTATYASFNKVQNFEHPLPTLQVPHSPAEKTAYLSTLRASVVELQEEVNMFLTAKMEEDKVIESKIVGKLDDKKEEENYGEEMVDDDG